MYRNKKKVSYLYFLSICKTIISRITFLSCSIEWYFHFDMASQIIYFTNYTFFINIDRKSWNNILSMLFQLKSLCLSYQNKRNTLKEKYEKLDSIRNLFVYFFGYNTQFAFYFFNLYQFYLLIFGYFAKLALYGFGNYF